MCESRLERLISLSDLEHGDPKAVAEVYSIYLSRLVNLANKHLNTRLRRKDDPLDVVQSVFRSFLARAREGKLDLSGRDRVRNLLALWTQRKCMHRMRDYQAKKRDIRREKPLPDHPSRVDSFAREPTPDEAAIYVEIHELVLKDLSSTHQEIVRLWLEGYSIKEIGAAVHRVGRTVRRVIDRAEQRILALHGDAEHEQ